MRNRRAAEFAAVITAGVAIATVSALPASAAGPHPAQLCGALNMIEASPSFYGAYAVSGGMDNAMGRLFVLQSPAFQNMFDAVAVSSSHTQSPNCPTS